MRRLLKKLGGWIALGTMVMVGLIASLFIAACGGKAEAPPEPRPPDKPETAAPAKPDTAVEPSKPGTSVAPKTEAPAKPKVDREEVEKGQPIPRNYLE